MIERKLDKKVLQHYCISGKYNWDAISQWEVSYFILKVDFSHE